MKEKEKEEEKPIPAVRVKVKGKVSAQNEPEYRQVGNTGIALYFINLIYSINIYIFLIF